MAGPTDHRTVYLRSGNATDFVLFETTIEPAEGPSVQSCGQCSSAPRWICCQIGAREHYAVPRALWQRRRLDCLFTDAWAPPPPFSWLAQLPVMRRFAGRRHSDLVTAQVKAFTGSLLAFEAIQQMRRRHGWERTIARNGWFQNQVTRSLSWAGGTVNAGGTPMVFAYSYAALDIFRYAKERGWRTVLGQIDPGPVEQNVVNEEHLREPTLAQRWQIAPEVYWQGWREELSLADIVMVNSRWSYDALRQSGVPPEKLRIVPLAYALPEQPLASRKYPEKFTKQRPLRVLFLGQVNLRKGVARLLRAAARLPDTVELWMVGPRQIADDPRLTDNPRIRWFGPSSREMAADYYRRADVFILPTLSDSFAITQLESMAQRLPVIASTHCGNVVRDGVDGLLLPEPTAEAIGAALCFCAEHPERLAAFSQATAVRNEFSLVALSKNLLALEAPDSSGS